MKKQVAPTKVCNTGPGEITQKVGYATLSMQEQAEDTTNT